MSTTHPAPSAPPSPDALRPADAREPLPPVLPLLPSLPKWARLRRCYAQAVAGRLYDAGFRTFVEVASGAPTDDHVHAAVPGARVLYLDGDASAVARGGRALAGMPEVRLLLAAPRDVRAVLEGREATAFLCRERRVALGVTQAERIPPGALAALLRDLYDWAAPGARLRVAFETVASGAASPRVAAWIEGCRGAGTPVHLPTRAEAEALCGPWRLPAGGLVPLAAALGLPAGFVTEADHEGVGLETYAGVLEKP